MSDTCSCENCSADKGNVIARTKPNPNPNPIPYTILNLKLNHYWDLKPYLLEVFSPEQMSDLPSTIS